MVCTMSQSPHNGVLSCTNQNSDKNQIPNPGSKSMPDADEFLCLNSLPESKLNYVIGKMRAVIP